MRRTLVISLALAVSAAGAGQQAVPEPDERTERVRRAMEWLSNPDPDIREIGRRELLDLGPDAVPHLEGLLKARDAYEIHRLILEIIGRSPLSDQPKPLPEAEELLRQVPGPGAGEVDRYVFSKLREAQQVAKAHQYEKAYETCKALLQLEPKSRYAATLRDLLKYCDHMFTQYMLVRSRVVGPAAAVAGSKLDLMLRMDNVFRAAVEIRPAAGGGPSRALAVLEIACDRFDSTGAVTRITRPDELTIDSEIPIAMGAQWERPFTLDTSIDFPEDSDNLRVYTVGAWIPLARVDSVMGTLSKRIYFDPVVIKVIPEKYLHLAEDPLAKLGKVMDAGTAHEVFLCAMLLDDAQRPAGVELLVTALEKAHESWKKATTPEARDLARRGMAVTANILAAMTKQHLGADPRAWREYANSLRSEAKAEDSKVKK